VTVAVEVTRIIEEDSIGAAKPARSGSRVCVRNMFEERAGNPGYLDVSIVPAKPGGALARATVALRRLFT
jgi:hypothetical protein